MNLHKIALVHHERRPPKIVVVIAKSVRRRPRPNLLGALAQRQVERSARERWRNPQWVIDRGRGPRGRNCWRRAQQSDKSVTEDQQGEQAQAGNSPTER